MVQAALGGGGRRSSEDRPAGHVGGHGNTERGVTGREACPTRRTPCAIAHWDEPAGRFPKSVLGRGPSEGPGVAWTTPNPGGLSRKPSTAASTSSTLPTSMAWAAASVSLRN